MALVATIEALVERLAGWLVYGGEPDLEATIIAWITVALIVPLATIELLFWLLSKL